MRKNPIHNTESEWMEVPRKREGPPMQNITNTITQQDRTNRHETLEDEEESDDEDIAESVTGEFNDTRKKNLKYKPMSKHHVDVIRIAEMEKEIAKLKTEVRCPRLQ